MKIFGIAGWSGSGKTTLMLKLIAALRARGVRVSSIKRTHHTVEVDEPDSDSRRLRQAGAHEALIAGPQRWALIHDLRDEPEPRLDDVLPRFADCDLLLVEGFKRNPHRKLEVYRPAIGKPLLCVDDPNIVAVATTSRDDAFPVPSLDLDDVDAIVTLILRETGLDRPAPVG